MRPSNGNGHDAGGRGSAGPARGGDRRVLPAGSTASAQTRRPVTASCRVRVRRRPQPELVIRFREALDYERSIAIFQRIQQVLKSHSGSSVGDPRAAARGGWGAARADVVPARPSPELAEAVANEVGGDVVEVVLPR